MTVSCHFQRPLALGETVLTKTRFLPLPAESLTRCATFSICSFVSVISIISTLFLVGVSIENAKVIAFSVRLTWLLV